MRDGVLDIADVLVLLEKGLVMTFLCTGDSKSVGEPQTQPLTVTRIFYYTSMCSNINLEYCRRCNQVCQTLPELCGCRWGLRSVHVSVSSCTTWQWGWTEVFRGIFTEPGPMQPLLIRVTAAFNMALVAFRSPVFLF